MWGYYPSDYSGRNLTHVHKKTHQASDSDPSLSDQDFQTELQAIRNTIKTLKAEDKLKGKALDDILKKHDNLMEKRALYLKSKNKSSNAPQAFTFLIV